MTRYQTLPLLIQVQSPLLLGTDREFDTYSETRDYIAGSVLRGSLARLLEESQASEPLAALFGPTAPPLIFENLHATPGGSATQPLPLSARTCKYNPGFSQPNHPNRHGVGDILISQTMIEQALIQPQAELLPWLPEPRCPVCGEEVTRPTIKFYETTGQRYQPSQTPVRRQARTAINRRRYTAEDQLLYTLETIEPGQPDGGRLQFRGAVRCRDAAQKATLEQWLPQVGWLGRGRSRGLGQIRLTIPPDADDGPPLLERLTKFNAQAQQEQAIFAYLSGSQLFPDDTLFFSLDLLAPTIFNHCGLPATRPALADLGLDPAQADIYRAFTDDIILGGWHLKAGLPRRKVLAAVAGSCYLIGVRQQTIAELAETLQPLETLGLGAERERGLGRVIFSSPIHYKPEVTLL